MHSAAKSHDELSDPVTHVEQALIDEIVGITCDLISDLLLIGSL